MNPEELVIRPAIQADLEDLVRLLQELFSLEVDFTPDPERQRRGLAVFLEGCGKHRCLLVAEAVAGSGAALVAMASVQVLISTAAGGTVGLIEDVVVTQAHRGRGAGRRLMMALCEWADQRGLKRLQLLADRQNGPALNFYAKLGWQSTQLICLRHR